ncbi:hypothetical protein E2C01_001878 [Portunus trituberculatus]|uniref:Uncharacterized protein n=1 Tax=Portunus trituberculatus TaxID=210409 RepID=A0A5B7CNN1_PORTR|nr:hypothetical protein [Portunus trituberculatus]
MQDQQKPILYILSSTSSLPPAPPFSSSKEGLGQRVTPLHLLVMAADPAACKKLVGGDGHPDRDRPPPCSLSANSTHE